MVLVEVREIQDDLVRVGEHGNAVYRDFRASYIGDKAALEDTKQRAAGEKRASAAQPKLREGDDAPEAHLRGDPSIGAHPLGDELGGQFSAQKRELEDSVAQVVICEAEHISPVISF